CAGGAARRRAPSPDACGMSGEAAARTELVIASRRATGPDGGELAAPVSVGSDALRTAGGAPLTQPALVASEAGEADRGVGVEVVAAGADPRSVLDALLSAAADLIGQAIELHRGLEAVSGTPLAEDDPDPSLSGLVADYERRL